VKKAPCSRLDDDQGLSPLEPLIRENLFCRGRSFLFPKKGRGKTIWSKGGSGPKELGHTASAPHRRGKEGVEERGK